LVGCGPEGEWSCVDVGVRVVSRVVGFVVSWARVEESCIVRVVVVVCCAVVVVGVRARAGESCVVMIVVVVWCTVVVVVRARADVSCVAVR
jgi:hypothetical protein